MSSEIKSVFLHIQDHVSSEHLRLWNLMYYFLTTSRELYRISHSSIHSCIHATVLLTTKWEIFSPLITECSRFLHKQKNPSSVMYAYFSRSFICIWKVRVFFFLQNFPPKNANISVINSMSHCDIYYFYKFTCSVLPLPGLEASLAWH